MDSTQNPSRARSSLSSPAKTTLVAPASSERVYPIERWLVGRLLAAMGSPPVRVTLWNGEDVLPTPEAPVARLRIRDRQTLYRLLWQRDIAFGEAYTDGRIEVDGDLPAFVGMGVQPAPHPLSRFLERAPRPRANSLRGSRDNIHQHYDLGNDFYRLWLDERMLYTCAYFASPDMTLEQAQVAKMDHVCRKVGLRPGQRVVEAGCGWGALALHMAQHYGVTARAFNISHEQIAWAREQAQAQGLAERVEFVEDDYRNITGTYDAFVSVGMLEHVGRDHYRDLGRVIDRCLPAHGRGFLHTIGRHHSAQLNAWIEKHIFPGAYPPTLREMMEILEPFGFSVLDVENLRLHYAKTAEHWLERYERVAGVVVRMFDARFARAWRLYLSGVVGSFRAAALQLFQVTFARTRNNDVAWTRDHLYNRTPAGS